MSEAEALEVMSDFADNVATYFTMFVSFTFAYLTVAYLVGKSLSRFQCLAASGLYAVSAFVTGATTIGWGNAWLILKAREPTMVDQVWVFDKPGWLPVITLLLVAITLTSLYFMYDARKSE